MQRKQLRQSLREARNSLSGEQQHRASEALLNMVMASDVLQDINCCASYISNDGELDPKTVVEHCWSNRISTSLPVLHPFTKGNLLFLNYSEDSDMRHNKYGIPEPLCEVNNVIPIDQLDLVFVPLVGFDAKGNRLGMGGGYYDRTLQNVSQTDSAKIVGLAHDCQEVAELPIESWDIPLQLIITPTRIIAPS